MNLFKSIKTVMKKLRSKIEKTEVDSKKCTIGVIEMIGGIILMLGSGYFATGKGFYDMKCINFSKMNVQSQANMEIAAFLPLLASIVLLFKGAYAFKHSFHTKFHVVSQRESTYLP